MRVRSTFGVPEELMAVDVRQNEDISGGGKGVGSAISRKIANWESSTLRNESKEKLFSEMLTL